MPEVPHHIWHHRGQPRPTAKTGSNHEWTLEYSARQLLSPFMFANRPRTDKQAHEQTPNTDEEDGNLNNDSPSRHANQTPQELPVSTVRSRKPVVSQHLGDEEPDDELSAEQRLEEIGHVWRDLESAPPRDGDVVPLTWR